MAARIGPKVSLGPMRAFRFFYHTMIHSEPHRYPINMLTLPHCRQVSQSRLELSKSSATGFTQKLPVLILGL